MVRLVLTNGAKFEGEFIRVAGRNIFVEGRLTHPDNTTSILRWMINVSEIKQILEASHTEKIMLEEAGYVFPKEDKTSGRKVK